MCAGIAGGAGGCGGQTHRCWFAGGNCSFLPDPLCSGFALALSGPAQLWPAHPALDRHTGNMDRRITECEYSNGPLTTLDVLYKLVPDTCILWILTSIKNKLIHDRFMNVSYTAEWTLIKHSSFHVQDGCFTANEDSTLEILSTLKKLNAFNM